MTDDICEGCENAMHITGLCKVYWPEGQRLRQRLGYCPIIEKYSDWRDDKPKEVQIKQRIGQKKQSRGK